MKKLVMVLIIALCFTGCAQVQSAVNANPDLVIKIGDLVADIAKIAGTQLIEVVIRSEASDTQIYRYKDQSFVAKDGVVIKVY